MKYGKTLDVLHITLQKVLVDTLSVSPCKNHAMGETWYKNWCATFRSCTLTCLISILTFYSFKWTFLTFMLTFSRQLEFSMFKVDTPQYAIDISLSIWDWIISRYIVQRWNVLHSSEYVKEDMALMIFLNYFLIMSLQLNKNNLRMHTIFF